MGIMVIRKDVLNKIVYYVRNGLKRLVFMKEKLKICIFSSKKSISVLKILDNRYRKTFLELLLKRY